MKMKAISLALMLVMYCGSSAVAADKVDIDQMIKMDEERLAKTHEARHGMWLGTSKREKYRRLAAQHANAVLQEDPANIEVLRWIRYGLYTSDRPIRENDIEAPPYMWITYPTEYPQAWDAARRVEADLRMEQSKPNLPVKTTYCLPPGYKLQSDVTTSGPRDPRTITYLDDKGNKVVVSIDSKGRATETTTDNQNRQTTRQLIILTQSDGSRLESIGKPVVEKTAVGAKASVRSRAISCHPYRVVSEADETINLTVRDDSGLIVPSFAVNDLSLVVKTYHETQAWIREQVELRQRGDYVQAKRITFSGPDDRTGKTESYKGKDPPAWVGDAAAGNRIDAFNHNFESD